MTIASVAVCHGHVGGHSDRFASLNAYAAVRRVHHALVEHPLLKLAFSAVGDGV
jgi:hypothetical protein